MNVGSVVRKGIENGWMVRRLQQASEKDVLKSKTQIRGPNHRCSKAYHNITNGTCHSAFSAPHPDAIPAHRFLLSLPLSLLLIVQPPLALPESAKHMTDAPSKQLKINLKSQKIPSQAL